MNMLLDSLPTHVEIDSENYKINSDFRTSVLFEMLMQDDEICEEEKIHIAIELYYDIVPNDINKAIEKILWFYRCGKDTVITVGSGSGKSNQIYSFDYDDDYIYSAFLDQYRVDLQDVDLHWWKFKAMFKGLKDDNEIIKIIGYRSMTINKQMSKEEKEFYKKMKSIHKIPNSKTENEKINQIEEALINGGNLDDIL